jgi:hypothetical protein
MSLLRRALGGLQGLLHRTRQDAELDRELRAFVESGVEHKMRSGMRREDATRAVRLELGSAAAVKDRVRDAGWESVLGAFAATAMIGVGLLAAYVPARHAARVQPIDALRRS